MINVPYYMAIHSTKDKKLISVLLADLVLLFCLHCFCYCGIWRCYTSQYARASMFDRNTLIPPSRQTLNYKSKNRLFHLQSSQHLESSQMIDSCLMVLQVFCIFLFVLSSTIFGTLLSQAKLNHYSWFYSESELRSLMHISCDPVKKVSVQYLVNLTFVLRRGGIFLSFYPYLTFSPLFAAQWHHANLDSKKQVQLEVWLFQYFPVLSPCLFNLSCLQSSGNTERIQDKCEDCCIQIVFAGRWTATC